jgi:NADH dehydrogenase [ubiquinone] 1 alpha subcomplex assembly factor 1
VEPNQRWRDGGLSSSQLRHDPTGHADFTGHVSLENIGGFASVRCQSDNFGRADVFAYLLEVRDDGKRYKLYLRTDSGFDGVIYPYQARFDPPAGRWTTCRLASADFSVNWRGRAVAEPPPLDTARVQLIVLMIADR